MVFETVVIPYILYSESVIDNTLVTFFGMSEREEVILSESIYSYGLI